MRPSKTWVLRSLLVTEPARNVSNPMPAAIQLSTELSFLLSFGFSLFTWKLTFHLKAPFDRPLVFLQFLAFSKASLISSLSSAFSLYSTSLFSFRSLSAFKWWFPIIPSSSGSHFRLEDFSTQSPPTQTLHLVVHFDSTITSGSPLWLNDFIW